MAILSIYLGHQTTTNSYSTLNFTWYFKPRNYSNPPLQNYNTIKRNVIVFVVQIINNLELTKPIRDLTVQTNASIFVSKLLLAPLRV